ncbi:MAG: choice-of-anchor D domain-containing protein [Candidatus Marinimicrobia bacterium]|nr:choice-of-anchor D domain-containing protein [Candidatus Neomarinimicrobiota bacterium]
MRKVVAVLIFISLGIVTNAFGQTWLDGIVSTTNTWDAGGTIGTPEDLAQFCYNVNNGSTYSGQTITLTANIDLNGNQWIPIGKGANTFDGTFDGDGYTISNMTVNEASDGAGFFGIVNNATIQNIGIVSGSVQGTFYVGAIAGRGNGTTTIETCFNNVNVSGNGELGGIGGRIYGTVTNCYNCGNITNGGGIIGNCYADISNCYNIGDVTNGSGIVSFLNDEGWAPTMSNCVSIGQTVGANKRVANGSISTLNNNYAWDGMTYDNSGTGAATVNGADITKVQVNTSSNWSNTWFQSFSDDWEMPAGELPNLKVFASDNVSMPTHLALAPEMNVQGNSTNIADGDDSPVPSDYTDFGKAAVSGGIDERTFTIQNTGTADLTLTTPITVTGDFSCTSQPTSPVAAGGSTTFTIQFNPSTTGTRSGSVSIANNDGDENPYNFDIQGEGIDITPNGLGNYALDFDGTNDYVDCGNDASIQINGSALTLEAWIYADDLSGGNWTRTIIDRHGSGGNDGYVLRCGDDGSGGLLNFTIGDGVSFFYVLSDDNTLSPGEWNHVAGTYDGNDLKAYINGKLVKTETIGLKTISIDPANMCLGYGAGVDGRYFDGRIDEARVWNDARTAEEIRENMYKDVTGSSNLVAYYKMSDGSGTSVMDNSINGNTGTMVNGPVWTASGALGGSRQALDFDGTDDYVDCGNNASVQITGSALSVESWIYLDNFEPNYWDGTIIDKWDATENGYGIRCGGNGILSFNIGNGADWYEILSSSNALALNTWTHVAGVYDGTNQNLYINGELVNSTNIGPITITNAAAINLRFGIGDLYPTRILDGKIDEVRIWNDARTQTEIQENMMKTLVGDEAGLAAYYRFDQMDGTTVYDMTSNGNNGTLTNMDANTVWIDGSAFSTWIGTESTAWATDANWTDGSPSATQSAGIYDWTVGALTTYEATISGPPSMNSLFLSSTSTPTMSSGITLGGSLILQRNLNQGANNITLGSNGYLVESGGTLSGTTGYIQTTRAYSSAITAENIANLGASITTDISMGSTNIKRGYSNQSGTGLSSSVDRYYDITPTTNTGLNATLVFPYLDGELNGITEADLKLHKSTDGGTNWTNEGGTVTAGSNIVTLTGIDGFSRWTAGISPEMNVQGNGNGITDGDDTPSLTDHTDFDSISVASGSQDRTFTIQNTGTATLSITTPIAVTGDFSCTSQPANTVNAGATTTFTIRFDPTASGTRSGTVSVANSDGDENPYNFSVQGTGTENEINIVGNGTNIADGDVNPSAGDHTDFGEVVTSTATVVRTFTIQNTGNIDLNLTGVSPYVTITGHTSDFTLTQTPVTPIAAGGNTTFQITFDPDTVGTRTAIISIANDDSDENPYNFSIQGIGAPVTELINGLDADEGFGDSTTFVRTDDAAHGPIDITPVFGASGLKFGDSLYTEVYVNLNGVLNFGSSTTAYTANPLSDGVSSGGRFVPSLAVYWTDLETTSGTVTASGGGNSTGSNLVYYHIDSLSSPKRLIVTWDDVAEYNDGVVTKVAAQIILENAGAGNMDISYLYEYAETPDDGLGDATQAGWHVGGSAGGDEGIDWYEIPLNAGGNLGDLDERAGNTGTPGLWKWYLRNGSVKDEPDLPPTGSNNQVYTSEDVSYTFKESDFTYSDADGDTFSGIYVTDISSVGNFTYFGNPLTKNRFYGSISGLNFKPDTNETSASLFKFKVRAANGVYSDNAYIMKVNVIAVDDPPVVKDSLENYTYLEEGDDLIGLDRLFTDVDNEDRDIVKSVHSISNPALVSATILAEKDQLALQCLENQNGTTLITIKGTSNGLFALDSFEITVLPVDDSIQVANPIEDVAVLEDAENLKINLSDVFVDIDDPVIEKRVSGNTDSTRVIATVDGDTLILDFQDNQFGQATITVEGSSAGLQVYDEFLVTITPVNDPPTGGNDAVTLFEDSTYTFKTSDFTYHDVEENAFDGIQIATIESDGVLQYNGVDVTDDMNCPDLGLLTFISEKDEFGTPYATFTFKVKDDAGALSDSVYTMTINVTEQEDSPVVSNPIEKIEISEDSDDSVFDLKNLFSDPDDNTTTFTKYIKSISDSTILNAWIRNDSLFIEYYPNKYGTVIIEIAGVVDERDAGTITRSVLKSGEELITEVIIEIEPVNDAPEGQNNQISTLENMPYPFQSGDFIFQDVDGDTMSGIRIITTIDKGQLLCANQSVKDNDQCAQVTQLLFIPDSIENGTPYTSFTFRIRDQNGAYSDSVYTMSIHVTDIQYPPFVKSPIPDVIVDEDAANIVLDLSSTFSDLDNDDAAIIKTLDSLYNHLLFTALVDSNTLTLDFGENQFGIDTLVLLGTSGGQTVQDSFVVTVNPINDPPLSAHTSITMNEDESYTFQPEDFPYNDIENDPFAGIRYYTAVNKGTLRYDGEVITDYGIFFNDVTKLVYTPIPGEFDSAYATFNFRVADSGYGYSDDKPNLGKEFYTMTIHVLAVADAPVVAHPVADIHTFEDAPDTALFIGNVFTDADSDDEEIVRSLLPGYNDTLLTATITGDSLLLSFGANQYGSTEITLRGTSGEQFAEDVFSVSVSPINDAPAGGDGMISTDEEIAYNFKTADFPYTDIENHLFSGIRIITAESAGDLEYMGQDVSANTNCSDMNNLVFRPAENSHGSPYATFTFQVRDSENALSEATYTMTINVVNVNDAPVLTNKMADTTLYENATLQFDYKATDADNDPLNFGMIAGTVDDTAQYFGMHLDSLTGEYSWTTTYNDAGVYAVGVYVSDMLAMDTDTFFVTVLNVNRAPEFTRVLPDTTVNNDVPLEFGYEASDPDGDALTFGLMSTVDSLTLAVDGFLSWTLSHFTADSQQEIAVYVTDNEDTVTTSAMVAVHNVVHVAIDEELSLPDKFELGQNYPNPFNPTTNIKFNLPKNVHVNISIYDVSGKLVETLVNEQKEAGYHQFNWDAGQYSTGLYFYRIIAGDFVNVKKCLLVK